MHGEKLKRNPITHRVLILTTPMGMATHSRSISPTKAARQYLTRMTTWQASCGVATGVCPRTKSGQRWKVVAIGSGRLIKGISGYDVYGFGEGKKVFLPAAGLWDDTGLYLVGSGNYWSSSLDTDRPYGAWLVYFSSGNVDGYNSYRFNGFTVRPVYVE